MNDNEHFEMIANEFYLDTGYLAPGKSESPTAWYQGRAEERHAAWTVWNKMRKAPCPQCARFREKVAGLEHFIRKEGLYDHPGDAGIIAPKFIKYLTE
jgi:hypothetical protein